jgi:phospholipid transport system substrate-binding protein
VKRALRGIVTAGALVCVAGAAPAPAGSSGPSVVIRETADAVVAVLNDGALDSAQRRQRIEDIAYERFDFDTISRLVLGRNWKALSPAQQEEFRREFRSLLSESYGRRIDRYEQEQVKIVGERPEQRGDVTVQTKIVGGQANDLQVDYRLRQKDGVWLVIDVVVEGASLLSNYRSQFAEVWSQGGAEGLLKRMRERKIPTEPASADAG